MSYRDNQYFNLSSAGEDLDAPFDNNEFVYPPNVARHHARVSDAPNGSPFFNEASRWSPVTTPLKRGYIRGLMAGNTIDSTGNETSVPIRKCAFQFNPATLNQSVQQNTAILNFLQQDAAQYAQPIPGNVSFQFDLFFDRSAELNGPQGSVYTTDPWNSNGPEQVGVLHDLSKLYSIVGQGLSKDQRDYAQGILEDQIRSEINRNTAEGISSGTDSVGNSDTLAVSQEYSTTASDFLDLNIGNSAFILPLPVRVVFSSLYIVEGLVSNVSVVFTKFNAAMVPMQCNVNILMEAKYIGFAKRDTFFTSVLAQRREREIDSFNEYASVLGEVLPIVGYELRRVQIYVDSRQPNTREIETQSASDIITSLTSGLQSTVLASFPNYKPDDDSGSVNSLKDNGATIDVHYWYKIIAYNQSIADKYVEGDESADYSSAIEFAKYLDSNAGGDAANSIALLNTSQVSVFNVDFSATKVAYDDLDNLVVTPQDVDEVDATYLEERYFVIVKKIQVVLNYSGQSFSAEFPEKLVAEFINYGDDATPPSSTQFPDNTIYELEWPQYVAQVGDVPSVVI